LDDRTWKNISIVLGVVCALLFGAAGALMVIGNKGGKAAAPQSSEPTFISGDPTPTPSVGVTSPTVTSTPGPGATPTPTGSVAAQGAPGTIAFTGLALDGEKDTTGNGRTFTFVSDGAGPVTFAVTKSSGATTRMCAKVDGGAFACKVGVKPNFLQGIADGPHNTWTVVLYGYATAKPTVDVTFTWPAVSHKITLTHGRFQGSSTEGVAEALNGFTAQVKPPAAGAINVQASWTAITTDVEMSLSDVTTQPAVVLDTRPYPAATFITPAYNFNVDPTKTYLLKLRNTSADSQRPDLTAQITFP
jgi:hypothetical protein